MKLIVATALTFTFSISLPPAFASEITDEAHKRCLEARDYQGCIKVFRKDKNRGIQEFVGIGIQIFLDQDTANIVVHSSIEGSPAARSGVESGDVILFIDGKSTKGMGLKEAVNLIQGKEGSKVKIVFQRTNRSGKEKQIKLNLTRNKIQIPNQKIDLQPQIQQWIYKGFPNNNSPFFPNTKCVPSEEDVTNFGLQI